MAVDMALMFRIGCGLNKHTTNTKLKHKKKKIVTSLDAYVLQQQIQHKQIKTKTK